MTLVVSKNTHIYLFSTVSLWSKQKCRGKDKNREAKHKRKGTKWSQKVLIYTLGIHFSLASSAMSMWGIFTSF